MRVGILGGGQLGTMLAESLLRLDAEVSVFAHEGSTAHQRLRNVTVGDFKDVEAVRRFVEACDVVTCEMEHVPIDVLDQIDADYRPSRDVLRITQHRAKEKEFLVSTGLPHAAFNVYPTSADLSRLTAFPCIVKTALGGYDGLGQRFVDSPTARDAMIRDVADALGAGFVAEEPITIEAEISCVVARDVRGKTQAFPVVRNAHRFHVLDTSVSPTGLPEVLEAEATRLAIQAADELDVVGLLTTEFFVASAASAGPSVDVDGLYLLVNEFAPRPHNSGHVTRKSCSYSQYDALANILMGLPLPQLHQHAGGFAMANLLSDIWHDKSTLDLSSWESHPVDEVYLYGKRPNRDKRKMGHVIAGGRDAAHAEQRVRGFRTALEDRQRG